MSLELVLLLVMEHALLERSNLESPHANESGDDGFVFGP
jgi:hypothetical protein